MIIHEVFAHIADEEIKNIIVCDNYSNADYLAKCIYGDEAFAVDILQYKVSIGDKYRNGIFYTTNEDGEEIIVVASPTQEQQVNLLTAELEDAQLALVEAHSENNQLSSEILTLQQAIVELYEKGGM